ncbi:MAG: nicotinate-nucleotide adenylyltransferase [Rubritepida sp.]|nr:nicotinate-nucleotide adenylyltransferase [Rubritepida sp.]
MSGAPGRFGDGRRQRIGILGGSFNPAHAGHAHVALAALRALRLDQVWLMVSPGNPLKPSNGMAPFAERLASARGVAKDRRVIATDIERRLGSRFTHRTLSLLRRRFRRARFVLILGADNLTQLPRWHRWRDILDHTPLAVLPRPGYSRAALRGQAASLMAHRRQRASALLNSCWTAGAPWCFVPAAERVISATAIRAASARAATSPIG